jgi:hypothetical protein
VGWRSGSGISWAHHRHKAAAGVFRDRAPNRYLFTVFAVKVDKFNVADTSAVLCNSLRSLNWRSILRLPKRSD